MEESSPLAAKHMKEVETHGHSVDVTPSQPFLPIALLKYEKKIVKGRISPLTSFAPLLELTRPYTQLSQSRAVGQGQYRVSASLETAKYAIKN